MRSRRGLQAVLAVFGTIPLVTGVMAVLGGPADMLDGQVTTSTVDNEVRFLAVYWFAFGGFVWWLVPRVERATAAYRAMLAVMFASGVARALSTLLTGWPHPVIRVAMVVELLAPPVLLWWQRRLARTGPAQRSSAVAAELEPSAG
jgi:hypothetical protein